MAGPTASGKTALGVALAEMLDGEVISCDSMQIYKDIPICSAQPTEAEKRGIPHHLMGFLDFDSRFTVADYREQALFQIRNCVKRNKLPVVVGGTGMYFHWLMYKPEFGADSNPEIKKALERFSNDELYKKLLSVNSETKISINDRKRLIRALEVYELTGQLPTSGEIVKNTDFDFRLFCISPDREELYDKINRRVDIMLENGMVDEVKALWSRGLTDEHQCFKAIGCRQLIDFFENRCSFEEAIESIKRESRRYAKRQLTWMRSEHDAIWLHP